MRMSQILSADDAVCREFAMEHKEYSSPGSRATAFAQSPFWATQVLESTKALLMTPMPEPLTPCKARKTSVLIASAC